VEVDSIVDCIAQVQHAASPIDGLSVVPRRWQYRLIEGNIGQSRETDQDMGV